MQVIYKEGFRVPVKLWNDHVLIEPEAIAQAENLSKLPFVFKHVALMPDSHAGKGCTVGAVVATRGAIIPSICGVDIGCGVAAYRTSLKANQLPDNLQPLYDAFLVEIPVGMEEHKIEKELPAIMEERSQCIVNKNPFLNHLQFKSRKQFGTLGGGNHAFELSIDENQDVWLLVHSGSRKAGGVIGEYFIDMAKEDMLKYYITLPDQDLAYIPENTDAFNDYYEAMTWAQDYAKLNRQEMLDTGFKVMSRMLPAFTLTEEAINCHHNYSSLEHHFTRNVYVTRKGAIRARKGELGIILGSMGTKSHVVRGLGNPDSFHSCSHGAGRTLSRTRARATISLGDHVKATMGIMCRKDESVLDESPAAYKDIDSVMASQTDLVEIVHTLNQVLCIKG